MISQLSLSICQRLSSSLLPASQPIPLVASMHPKHYRIRMFFDICRGFIVPSAVLSLVTSQTNIRLGCMTLPCHIFAVLLWTGARILYAEWMQPREARKLGAIPIPRVNGKWPGNVDVLFSMMRSFKTSYLFDTYLNLFEEYQCTTLNLRILWEDQVRLFFCSTRACNDANLVENGIFMRNAAV